MPVQRGAAAIVLAAVLAGAGAGGAAQASPRQPASAFAAANLATFSSFALSNGLRVIVKRNLANRVQHLSLVIRGGSAAAGPDTAGYEALALRTMARGSASWSYEQIQTLLDETSSGMGSSSGFDYSTFSLNTLDKYFERLFPLWVDILVHPSFRQADFDQELSQARLGLESQEQDPWSKTALETERILFAGHPYAASPDGSLDSLAKVRLEDMKAWYEARINARSLFVVAVGNFDPEALRARLEAGLGKLPSTGAALPPTAPPLPVPAASSLAKLEFPQSKGMGYVRGVFAAPPPADPDYMPLNLGMKILDDLLFTIVRDRHGAVYSPGANIGSLSANYGTLSLFKTKVPAQAMAYMDEAVAVLASGRAVAVDPEASQDGFAPLADVLETAKEQYINETFARQATNGSIAGRIASSLISTGDYTSYLYDADRARAVTPAQVAAAVDRYLLKARIAWVALGSSEVLESLREEELRDFSGQR